MVDIGTPERYFKVMCNVLYGKLNIRVSEESALLGRNIWVQGYSQESMKCREEIVRKLREEKLSIEGATLIGRHTRMGDHSRIMDSNIDNFCMLGQYVNVERSAIMDAVKIGDYAKIDNSVLGRMVIVESSHEHPTIIDSTSVIGNNAHIRAGCRIIGTKIYPGLEISPGMTYVNTCLQSYEDVAIYATH